MPIYDNDGSVNFKISKLYDNDGSTNHALAKLYDNDGTVNSPLYSNGVMLYDNGVINTEITGGLDTLYRTGGATVQYRATDMLLTYLNNPNLGNWSRAIVWTKNLVNIAGFSRLGVEFGTTGTLGEMWLLAGPMKSQPGYSADNPQLMPSLVAKGYTTSTGIFTIDLSEAPVGSYYLALMGKPENGWNKGGTATVTRFWLE